jgi:hypothetical protein
MLNKIICPECSGEFRPIPKSMLVSCAGLWCPKCFKIFTIPEGVHKKKRSDKSYDYSSARNRYLRLLSQSPKRGIAVDITLDQFVLWWNRTPNICHYCKSTIDDIAKIHSRFKDTKKRHYFSSLGLTIDRKDSNCSYSVGNIVKCCLACNLIKGPIMSESEALLICPIIINRIINS